MYEQWMALELPELSFSRHKYVGRVPLCLSITP
jgi:hypothetical protein